MGFEIFFINIMMSQVKRREEEKTEKKIKVEAETESNMKGKSSMSNNTEASSDTSKETSKGASEIQKLDYIHVRSRRGQATDRHSLAERVIKSVYNMFLVLQGRRYF